MSFGPQHDRNVQVIPFIKAHEPGTPYALLISLIRDEFGWEYTKDQLAVICYNNKIKTGLKDKVDHHWRRTFTSEMEAFIRAHQYSHNNDQMFEALREMDGGDKLTRQMVVNKRRRLGAVYRKWTPEMHEFVKANLMKYKIEDLATALNEKFGTSWTRTQVTAFCSYNHYLKNKPRQKRRPSRTRPIGAERLRKSHRGELSYWEVKVAEPSVWRPKSHVMWEKYHGKPVPEGHMVVFLDSNRDNFAEDNLRCIPHKIIGIVNSRYGITKGNVEETQLVYNIATIDYAVSQETGKKSDDAEPVGGCP